MICYHSVIFFTICVSCITALVPEISEKQIAPCGLYGFRCLDKKRAQICDEKYEEGLQEVRKRSAPRVFECGEGLKCDEEKKEYCSPFEPSYSNCTNSDQKSRLKKAQQLRFRKKVRDVLADASDSTATTISEYDDVERTEKAENDPWNGTPPVTCTSHGFYPDTNNNSLFFFCDLKNNGKGFTLRHMQCGPHRIFESNFKACVLEGSTRNIRNEGENVDTPKILNASKNSTFNCSTRKPGKYPDENNCHIYHLCLRPDLYSPFEHLEVKCPDFTAYEHRKKICSKKAKKICSKQESMNIYCEEEIRFRETRSCSHYFLCYQDQVIEFLCPSGFQFDEKLQFCELAHFVDC